MTSSAAARRALVYGATGFTGRLVVDEARRHGLELVLAGRRREALEELAAVSGASEVRVADAARPASLAGLCEGVGVVINCVGPFTRLGEPVLRAAIEAGVHYLDTTGEQEYMARAMDVLAPEAERQGVTAILAHAFEYAVGDCAARIAIEQTPGAETVEVFNRTEGFGASRGSKKSVLEALAAPALALVNGRRRAERFAAHRARVRFPDEDEERIGISFGGGEVLSAQSYATTVRTVRNYLVVPAAAAWALPSLVRAAHTLLGTRARSLLARRIDAGPFGPGEERRDQPWWVLARVRAPGGGGTRVTVSGYDVYGTTAVLAVRGARGLLAGEAKRPGIVTTAQAFDPRALLDALADSGVAWRIDPIPSDAGR